MSSDFNWLGRRVTTDCMDWFLTSHEVEDFAVWVAQHGEKAWALWFSPDTKVRLGSIRVTSSHGVWKLCKLGDGSPVFIGGEATVEEACWAAWSIITGKLIPKPKTAEQEMREEIEALNEEISSVTMGMEPMTEQYKTLDDVRDRLDALAAKLT